MRLVKPTYLVKNYFNEIETKKRDSIYAWSPFERFIWELKEDLPINYENKGKNELFLEYEEPIGINVFVNEEQLFRNKLPNTVLEKYEGHLNNIQFKFTFNSDYESIKPFEARGIKIRVNNVGVGKRTDFGLKRDRGFSRLHWIAGELQIENKIKTFLSINRDEFVSSPEVDAIIEFCAEHLRIAAYYVETVAVEEKKIKQSFEENIRDKVESRNKIISSSIKKLENKGFEVIEDISRDELVSIDKDNKTVYINKSIEKIERDIETISIFNSDYEITYSENFEEESQPCKLINNEIVINKNFPLFKSKTYGAVFRKIILILLIRENDKIIDESSYKKIVKDLLQEFKEFI
mgnify:FL=1